MFDRGAKYSYRTQRLQRYRLIKIILVFLLLYIAYNCFTAFFFSVWAVENDTMQPSLSYGDRLIFTSFKPPAWISGSNDEQSLLFSRGSIVLVDTARNKEQKLPLRIIDGIVRFFTAQRVTIFSARDYHIKRVIGLPGDEVSMSGYMFRVKTPDNTYRLTEFELTQRPYHPAALQTNELWDESLPFSGNMDPLILGPGECFVVADDRSTTNDSRTWGPVPLSQITAKAVLRFWPLGKIQRL